MSAAATAGARLAALLAVAAEQGAQTLASLTGGEASAGPLFEPGAPRLQGYETGVAFEIGGAFDGTVVVLFPAPVRERLIGSLGSRAQADPGSALAEVANIVASQAVSAIADALGARVTLSVPRLAERGSGVALARALRSGAPALASEVGAGDAGARALLVLIPGGLPRSAIP